MKPHPTPAYVLSATALALLAVIYWGVSPIGSWPASGVGRQPATGAEIVRKVMPYRLVQPEWVGSQDDAPALVVKWQVAEIKARLSVVLIFWVLAIVFVFYRRQCLGGKSKPATAQPPSFGKTGDHTP